MGITFVRGKTWMKVVSPVWYLFYIIMFAYFLLGASHSEYAQALSCSSPMGALNQASGTQVECML